MQRCASLTAPQSTAVLPRANEAFRHLNQTLRQHAVASQSQRSLANQVSSDAPTLAAQLLAPSLPVSQDSKSCVSYHPNDESSQNSSSNSSNDSSDAGSSPGDFASSPVEGLLHLFDPMFNCLSQLKTPLSAELIAYYRPSKTINRRSLVKSIHTAQEQLRHSTLEKEVRTPPFVLI
jgi:hypothetical protein